MLKFPILGGSVFFGLVFVNGELVTLFPPLHKRSLILLPPGRLPIGADQSTGQEALLMVQSRG